MFNAFENFSTQMDIDVEALNEEETLQLSTFLEQQTNQAEFRALVSEYSEVCFPECVSKFSSGNLQSKERKCLEMCTRSFIRTTKFLVDRFSS